MLLLSFTVGTWVKAPGLKQAGRIVGFVADDDGQWRIVVADRIEGGEGELKRDYAPAELTIVPGERNAVLEACATAMLARRGCRRASCPLVAFFIFIVVRGIIRNLRGFSAVPRAVPHAQAPRRLISAGELIAPPTRRPEPG
jgi:hypothetical protein